MGGAGSSNVLKVEQILERNQKLLQKMNLFATPAGSSKEIPTVQPNNQVQSGPPSKFDAYITGGVKDPEQMKVTLQREFAEQI